MLLDDLLRLACATSQLGQQAHLERLQQAAHQSPPRAQAAGQPVSPLDLSKSAANSLNLLVRAEPRPQQPPAKGHPHQNQLQHQHQPQNQLLPLNLIKSAIEAIESLHGSPLTSISEPSTGAGSPSPRGASSRPEVISSSSCSSGGSLLAPSKCRASPPPAKARHLRKLKAHLCAECGRTFSRSDMLTRHARLHSGLKPYQCAKCKQVFSRSDHLSTHERTHTGEKPYQCQLCAYSACRRDMITRHMRTHGARPQDAGQALVHR